MSSRHARSTRKPRVRQGGGTPAVGFIEPCFATSSNVPPSGQHWVHEIEFDGYRAQAHVRDRTAVVYSQRGQDWSTTYGPITPITDALQRLKARSAVLDGEIVVQNEYGVSDLRLLQADLAKGVTDRLVYFVFDLLYLDGLDLRPAPLLERKQVLAELLGTVSNGSAPRGSGSGPGGSDPGGSGPSRSAPRATVSPATTPAATIPAPTNPAATVLTPAVPAAAVRFSDHLDADAQEVFTRACAMRLQGIVSKDRHSPYQSGVQPTWVKVQCVGTARPRVTTTAAGPPMSTSTARRRVTATTAHPSVSTSTTRPRVAATTARLRVPKENILQLLPQAVAPSKDELAAYWRRVSSHALKYLARRPLKLVRHTHDTTFYHMGPLPPIPPSVHQLHIRKRGGDEGTRVWVEDVEGLLGLVQMGVVEVHPWNATVDDIEHADTMVFDLDPGRGIAWDTVSDTALAFRDLLAHEGLESWPKLTGGKGVHVMVPLASGMSHEAAHRLSRGLAQQIAARNPRLYTLSAARADRAGRLFLDYLRNGRGTTAVGTYSPRARPGFPIAAPVTWRQLERGTRPDAFTLAHPFRAKRLSAPDAPI